ncbi:hypothetical protein DK41_02425 [Streptococcus agalactiae]|nr:hypothetical protein DK41_02425 [Streptococcus agalactiae]AIK75141.1 hypothetical protein DX05_02535 [Streptococcus agalactiae]ARC45816.1 hypothetical protein A6J82_11030 [Streptococcus agalactiae]
MIEVWRNNKFFVKYNKKVSYLGNFRLKTKSSEVILLGIFLALKEYNKRKKVFDEVFLCFTKKILNTIDVK